MIVLKNIPIILFSLIICSHTLAVEPRTKPAVPVEGEQTLGDVVELVVNANNLENRYVDLDTGTVFSYPKNMNTDSETEAAWREQKRIDMTFLLVDRKPSKIVHLLSCNMIAAPVSEDKWSCTEEELMLDAKKAEWERRFFPVEPANDSIVAKTDGDAAYPTFVFKTREGNVGVLQVLEILRNGQWDRQAKMRYWLLRNPSVKIEDDQIIWGEVVDGIICAVKPVKESFFAGEIFEFDITYKNVSNHPITVCTYPDDFYVWTRLEILASKGNTVLSGRHATGIKFPPKVSDFATLQPGQSASVRQKIEGYKLGIQGFPIPGKYAAKVSISGINRMEKYVPNFDGFCKKHNIKPWTGVIKSGPAAFMVIPMPEIQWGEEAEGLHVGIGEPEVKDGSIKVPAFLRNKRSDDKKHFDGADYQIILNNKLYLSYQWPALNGRQVTVYPEQVRGPFWIDLSDYVNESNRDQSYQADRPLKQLPKGKYNLRVIYVGRNGKPRISSPEINVTIPDDSSWGESVEGLQVRLRTDKMVWRMGETPTFSLDLRNNGKKVFNYVRIMEAHCRIEYDGQWYIWADPIMISAPTWPLRPGIQVNGAIKVKLVKSWGIKMGGKERLELTPGRHMVRVRFTPGGGEVQAVSNPVEIEILAVGVKPAIMEGVKQIDVLSWGEAVEGVQCRLRADKQIWKTNETVTFKADIRNQGNKRWGIGPERWKRKFCEVEFDGAWHSWPYPASVHLPDGVLQENHQFNDVLIPLDERLGGVNVTPGRHVVRVAFFREPVNPANRVVSKPVEIEILPTEKSDVQVEGGKKREGQSPKDVILPDVDTKALMLDLATGELVDTPKVRGKIALWTAIERFGKGDLVYDAKALTLVRGATTQAATEKIVGPFKAYRISQTLPEVLIIKTKEGREYVVKIFSADKESCRLEYYLQTTPDVQVEGEGSKGQGKLRDQEEPTYAGRSLTELIAALSDQDFQTRINAVYHLGYMGQKAKPAVPALVDALNQKPLRESVLHSLGNIGVGAEDAIPALMKVIAEYPSTWPM